MTKLLSVLLCVVVLASAASANLVVGEAYYRDTNASLHLFVTNTGAQAATILPPVVSGFDTAALSRDGLKIGPVLWYRVRPNPIPAGGTADVVITLAKASSAPVSVELHSASGERAASTVQCAPEPFRLQAVRFSGDLRTVYLYARWSSASVSDKLKSVDIDGVDATVHASPLPANSDDGIGYTSITLDKPLAQGSFHVFEVKTAAGLSTAYQIRAIPAEFLVGVYGAPSLPNVEDWAAHGCNHYLAFNSISPEIVDRLYSHGLTVGAKYIPEPLVDKAKHAVVVCDDDASRKIISGIVDKPGLLYHELVDEPDTGDAYAGRRIGASSMELVARQKLCEECDPHRYTFVQMDNTFRPDNYRVYGEMADVMATHRYGLGSAIQGEGMSKTSTALSFIPDLQDTVSQFRAATEPDPFFMVTEFFSLGKDRSGRPPTIEEMRLQCYIAVAGGARGVVHYIHSGSSGGHEGGKTPALWDAMKPMHEELRRVGDIIDTGTPAPDSWVSSGDSGVHASAILAGDKMAVIAVNTTDVSALEQFTAHPADNVNVTVRIPSWIDASKLEVTAADSMKPVASNAHGNLITFTIDDVRDARCFLLRPRSL